MQCPDCGAVISKNDVFCGECGRPLADLGSVQEPLAPAKIRDLPTIDAGPPPALPPPSLATPRRNVIGLVVGVLGGILALCVIGVAVIVLLLARGRGAEEPIGPGTQPGQLVFADDFGDAASGWDVYNTDDTWAGYVDGEYRLGVYGLDLVTWGNPLPDQGLTNFEIEVDARQVEGPLDNNLGVLVRYQSGDENFYWFQISSDGYYSVDLLIDDEWLPLVEWEESAAIKQGLGVTNHIKVVCDGDRFSFYVNDTYLVDVTDDTFGKGNIGLAAGTFDEAGVLVHFDNLRVRLLQE